MKKIGLLALLAMLFSIAGASAQMADTAKLSSADFIRRYGDLDNVWYRISKEKKATIAFLGGSITEMEGWRGKVCEWFRNTYPETEFMFINAGIPSLGSTPHAFRLQQDVLDKGRVDLLFIESAVNDRGNGSDSVTQVRALEGIVRHARKSNPNMDMILMAFADENKIADYEAGKIPSEVAVHETIAKYYDFPFINLSKEITDRIHHKEFTWKDDFQSIHPSPFGHQLYFNTMTTLLKQSFNKKAPAELRKRPMPYPLNPFNYEGGVYHAVQEATKLQQFAVIPSWHPADGAYTRPGFVDVPVLEGTQAGGSFDFVFTGKTVGMGMVAGPDAGTIVYSIDNGPEKTMNLFTVYSDNLHLPWYEVLGDALPDRKHTLHVRIVAEHHPRSKGTVLRVVYFLVNK